MNDVTERQSEREEARCREREREAVSGRQTSLRDTKIITLSTDSTSTSQTEEK